MSLEKPLVGNIPTPENKESVTYKQTMKACITNGTGYIGEAKVWNIYIYILRPNQDQYLEN